MKLKFLYITIVLALLSACTNFLDEVQDNRTQIDTEEKVAKLLVNAYTNAQFSAFAESMSDNVDDKNSDGADGIQAIMNEDSYRWEDYESVTELDAPANFWEESYAAIAQANQALASLEKLEQKTIRSSLLRGEALLARAYAHFMLVNFFSMPYNAATADVELGIPYILVPEENAIVRYQRETMAETYRLIEEDLVEGLSLVGSDYDEPKFHFTPKSAHAFAARFYLYKGEWEKVIENASIVLGNGSPAFVIRDYVSAAANALTYSQRTIQYSSATERSNLLVAWTNSLVGRNFARYRYGLTADKLAELFSDRTTNPFRKAWAYDIYGIDNFYNIPKYTEYFRITNVSAGTGSANASVVHFTTDEALLNRAEAYAMLDRFDESSNDLTAYLSQKITAFNPATDIVTLDLMKTTYPVIENEYTPMYALSDDQASFVKGIAEFRRREFYHEGIRWLDVKRFNLVVTHVQKPDFSIISLPKDDPRRAIQIPETAKSFGIEANTR
jgi:hypothetical protein